MVKVAGLTRGAANVTVGISGLLGGYLQRDKRLPTRPTALLCGKRGNMNDVGSWWNEEKAQEVNGWACVREGTSGGRDG